ncbi:bifunctional UDP-N-acetylglucosamine diphosphorylase/glucosamine-1-phosphate N-acetyltransferase GlmU [Elusimicrobiota bacterium]
MKSLTVVILAAGEGTRMASRIPKVLHPLGGEPMLFYVIRAAIALRPKKIVIVLGRDEDRIQAKVMEEFSSAKMITFARQSKPLGTAHAVASIKGQFKDTGTLLVLYGDVPLVSKDSLEDLLSFHKRERNRATVLTARLANPYGYGRVVRGPTNALLKIVEEIDASLRELSIHEINSGIYAFEWDTLSAVLPNITMNNAKKEYYLTDTLEILRNQGLRVGGWLTSNGEEVLGINSRVDLARAESVLQRLTLEGLMSEGVTIFLPHSVFIEPRVSIGEDSVIYPGTIIKGRTVVGKGCVLGPNLYIERSTVGNNVRAHYSYIREATVADSVNIGPFSHLRPGTHVDSKARVGNFTEIKSSHIGEEAKVPHLSYIGDSEIGVRANIGAGTITCNYDGVRKNKTVIDNDTSIGSNVNLIAPVKIGRNSLIAAGSTITRDVPSNTLAVARSYQVNKRRNLN